MIGHSDFRMATKPDSELTQQYSLLSSKQNEYPLATRLQFQPTRPSRDDLRHARRNAVPVRVHVAGLRAKTTPERMIGADPEHWVTSKLGHWGKDPKAFRPEVVAEYVRCFRDPATIHATCEDYRAAAGIDLQHDAADLGRKLAMPLLTLWCATGLSLIHLSDPPRPY